MKTEPKSPLPAQSQVKPGLDSAMSPRPKYLAPDYAGASKLKGKVALITGGDSGIGRSVAVLYAREGADVAIIYLSAEQSDADEVAEAVSKEGQRALLIPGDVTDKTFCQRAVQLTIDEFGQLDILVNNAAYQQTQENFEDITVEQWEKTFQTNITGYFFMVKAALGHLKAGSAIINTGSITGMEGSKALVDYASTKGAIHAFTKSLAQNLAERRIRVNCIAPGPIWTPLQPVSKPPTKVAEHGADTPLKRPGQPEEVAPAFVFFASNADSSYISGEILTILGWETRAA
ncbi:SDR family oxidoreductase [Anatilimnocola floriformis]|uniref:SDR family oxidoreductase n=1 Tax=Anatilimnocola floriformis TaxID=2948575 RepID=UPI0020C5399B|nr:SDR family oxidoreductase [Anatilimnocola floriformis]